MRSDWSFGTVAGGGGTLRVGRDGTIGFAEEGEEEEDGGWDGEDDEDGAEYGSGEVKRGKVRGDTRTESGSEESVQGSTVRGVVSLLFCLPSFFPRFPLLPFVRRLSAHPSTRVLILRSFPQPKNIDVPALLASSPHGSRTDVCLSSEPNTPPTPPVPGFSPSGSGSMKRSSYAKRHDINGTVVTEGDLGNG